MKLGAKIFLCYVVISVVCFYHPINWTVDTLRLRYLEGVEDPLADQANILAEIVGRQMENGAFDPDEFYRVFERIYDRSLPAKIYDLEKTKVDMRVYITDEKGLVVFDSEGRQTLGEDYSRWRDVAFALKGEYGARTTQKDPNDLFSSVLYVAAPIVIDGKTAGVLTAGKPTTNINSFLRNAKPRIVKVAAAAAGASVLFFLLVSAWITRPIVRLARYADSIRMGKPAAFPRLDRTEIGDMGHAFERMRQALEGKEYVENYVQTLTHEIKSPLSAIRGAAELLEEQMPPEQRTRFLENIRTEANRIQDLVDRMLELSSLENRRADVRKEQIALLPLVKAVLESKRPLTSKKGIEVVLKIDDGIAVKGNTFLLHQAISNLIQNAIDFSPRFGTIRISGTNESGSVEFSVSDKGPGIPDYALEKIFDRFFSLQRPDGGKKSTGLGLNFVKEVAALHGGEVVVENVSEAGGARAVLRVPGW